jgi:hypothetical protein
VLLIFWIALISWYNPQSIEMAPDDSFLLFFGNFQAIEKYAQSECAQPDTFCAVINVSQVHGLPHFSDYYILKSELSTEF